MSNYVTDLTHFLTKDGRIAPTKGPAKRLADCLTMLVAYATAPPSAQTPAAKVQCFGEPGRKRCAGILEAGVASDTGAVHWHCPTCGNSGTISHWEGTLWDRRGDTTAH